MNPTNYMKKSAKVEVQNISLQSIWILFLLAQLSEIKSAQKSPESVLLGNTHTTAQLHVRSTGHHFMSSWGPCHTVLRDFKAFVATHPTTHIKTLRMCTNPYWFGTFGQTCGSFSTPSLATTLALLEQCAKNSEHQKPDPI